jgi:hypothetical protein
LRYIELTPEQEIEFQEWLNSRPDSVKETVRQRPPGHYYKLGENRCIIYSYSENGTVTVAITQELNPERLVIFNRQVFGVNPNDLTECDAPPEVTE